MRPDPRFLKQPKHFWANVRSISQHVGYTERGTSTIRVPTLSTISRALRDLGLEDKHVVDDDGEPSELGTALSEYFAYRADVLNGIVQYQLMDAEQAALAFEQVKEATKYQRAFPMNKQKGEKRKPAYLTAIVNMLLESSLEGVSCDYSPRELTTFTHMGAPLRTLARRIDGAFPSAVNPIAVWEIKEYYYTTTFGSRVADGVYESLLDGMELEELRQSENVECKHYMMIDAHYTWWTCGRSYLCRIVDMLHMGYVDEVLVGRELLERVPVLAKEWLTLFKARSVAV